jgi:streptomycin 6-kinase
VNRRIYSSEFEQFVSRHFGAQGRTWLDDLPTRVDRYCTDWTLELERFLPGGLMSCCLAVRTEEGQSAVLKIGGPWARVDLEAFALQVWGGQPAPAMLRADQRGGALLLERIVPGHQFEGGAEAPQIERLVRLLRALHAPSLSQRARRRLPALSGVVETQIATAGAEAAARSTAEALELEPRLRLARTRAAELLTTWDGKDVLLHGDLENKNILVSAERDLVATDPVPSVGDPAYDAAYWAVSDALHGGPAGRCVLLAEQLGLDRERVLDWARVIALAP